MGQKEREDAGGIGKDECGGRKDNDREDGGRKSEADLIQDGIKRRYFQTVSGPEYVFDCGTY